MREYVEDTIQLELPGDLTIFNIDWFSIFDLDEKQSLGSIIVPDGLNVPPSLVKVIVSEKTKNKYFKDVNVNYFSQ